METRDKIFLLASGESAFVGDVLYVLPRWWRNAGGKTVKVTADTAASLSEVVCESESGKKVSVPIGALRTRPPTVFHVIDNTNISGSKTLYSANAVAAHLLGKRVEWYTIIKSDNGHNSRVVNCTDFAVSTIQHCCEIA